MYKLLGSYNCEMFEFLVTLLYEKLEQTQFWKYVHIGRFSLSGWQFMFQTKKNKVQCF